jgi:hypothetical protein
VAEPAILIGREVRSSCDGAVTCGIGGIGVLEIPGSRSMECASVEVAWKDILDA